MAGSGRRLNDAAAEAGIVLVALALMTASAAAGFFVGRETGDGGGGGAAEVTTEQGETGAAGDEGETDGGPGVDGGTTETGGGETDTGGEGEGESAGGGAAEGEAVFQEAGCAQCHTLEAAGASGTVGPNLDESGLDQDQIAQVVTQGRGAMPSFEGQLSEEQIAAVAAYVAESKSG